MATARTAEAACTAVRTALESGDIAYDEPEPGTFVATLPGEHKLRTTCSLVVGAHTVSVNAFVARRPDENAEKVYRWLLERNLRLAGVAFALDRQGDIYLTGRLPVAAATPEEIDRLLGVVLDAADGSFNRILELGFAGAIRREWRWRLDRGESTANLTAFAHLIEPVPGGASPDHGSSPR